jgi:hypothetical protein
MAGNGVGGGIPANYPDGRARASDYNKSSNARRPCAGWLGSGSTGLILALSPLADAGERLRDAVIGASGSNVLCSFAVDILKAIRNGTLSQDRCRAADFGPEDLCKLLALSQG